MYNNPFIPIQDRNYYVALIYDGVELGRYAINCYGDVFDVYEQEFVISKVNTLGYLDSYLYTINGKKYVKNHRLVATAFCFRSKPNHDTVNHLDGNKQNNYYMNLEWTTVGDNILHAFDTGLKKRAVPKKDNVVSVSLIDEEVHIICKLLEQNVPYAHICDAIGKPKEKRMLDHISKIRSGKLWTGISNQYNIPQKEYRSPAMVFTEKQIHFLCRMIAEGSTNRYIAECLGIDTSNTNVYDKFLKIMMRIRRRETYTHISKEYIW